MKKFIRNMIQIDLQRRTPTKIRSYFIKAKSNVIAKLATIEQELVMGNLTPNWPPVFIMGPPRSGTTLIYQALARSFKVSYFTNISDKFYFCPAATTALLRRINKSGPPEDFNSQYGETKGFSSPSQGRHIWSRWFPADQSYVGTNQLSKEIITQIRGTIASIERSFDMPFLNKAQGHCARILPLSEIFKDALFIWVSRNPIKTAQSILKARLSHWGNYNSWISVKPKDYHRICKLDYPEQVCMQIYEIENDLRRDFSTIGIGRVFHISYERFCEDAHQVVADFWDFYRINSGISLNRRSQIPRKFREASGASIPGQHYELIKKQVDKLWRAA